MCLVVSSLSFSQTPEYKDYTVAKGDTLWDISNNELKDPFLWPKVWKENPEIKNPDLIYPGQKIRIPLYLLQGNQAGGKAGNKTRGNTRSENRTEAREDNTQTLATCQACCKRLSG